jgi:hypothetical protein
MRCLFFENDEKQQRAVSLANTELAFKTNKSVQQS